MKDLQKSLIEGIIPILGFYLWDWSLYFIFLFYFLDWVAKEILLHLQLRKIIQTQGGGVSVMKEWRKNGAVSGLSLIFSIVLIHLLIFLQQPQISFSQKTIEFLSYNDMGIAQGYILLPIIILGVYMQYKMEFIRFGFFKKWTPSFLWKENLPKRIGMLILITLGCLLAAFLTIPTPVILWISVLAPIVYLKFIKK